MPRDYRARNLKSSRRKERTKGLREKLNLPMILLGMDLIVMHKCLWAIVFEISIYLRDSKGQRIYGIDRISPVCLFVLGQLIF